MPVRDKPYASTTADTTAAKRQRVQAYFRKAPVRSARESNRHIAALCRVDESMVREWRAKLGVPKLRPGDGKPADEPAGKPKGRGRKK